MENLTQAPEGGLPVRSGAGFPVMAADSAGFVFDTASGISPEEQREILAGINRIAEKNRRSLSDDTQALPAGKKGGVFPVLVNVAAMIILAGGFFVLSRFHGREEVRVREGAAVYNPAERALIEEIRRETSSQLEAKENEISLISSKLTGVDAELQDLQSSVETMMGEKEAELRKEMGEAFDAERQRLVDQNLSEAAIAERMRLFDADRIARVNTELANYRQRLDAERAASESNLQNLQEEYRTNLSTLQNERSQILESSRAREASLHAQLEARTRELNAVSEQSQAALSSARSELERLSGEQEKAGVIESQLGGYYAAVNSHIRAGRLGEAAEAVRAMREFLNTPAFQSLKSIQARKELYVSAADSLDVMISEARKNSGAPAAGTPGTLPAGELERALTELQNRNAQLEETAAGLNRTIAAYSSQGSGLEQRIAEIQEEEAALRTMNQSFQQQVADRDQTIAGLQSQSVAQSEIITARESSITTLQAENASQAETIENLNAQLVTIRQALQALSQ
jgi:chromosome segregation ATPase